jgi:low affinity Fe/Cu permease
MEVKSQTDGTGGRRKRTAWFELLARHAAIGMGSPWAFVVALLVIAVWAMVGPYSGYSDTWQLVINTGTTIVTFLMVFLIQHTQNRDTEALQLKLDELIRALRPARNTFIDLEELDEEELHAMHAELRRYRGEQSGAADRPRKSTSAGRNARGALGRLRPEHS